MVQVNAHHASCADARVPGGLACSDNATMRTPSTAPSPEACIAATREWLEKAVIGLNLCPFAKAVHVKNQIRYVVSSATTPEALQAELADELRWLAAADPQQTDTTLLIHPQVLQDFLDFNDFLDVVDATVAETGVDIYFLPSNVDHLIVPHAIYCCFGLHGYESIG